VLQLLWDPYLVVCWPKTNWRWIFYLNIPVCGIALGVILLFMRVRDGAESAGFKVNFMSKLRKLDYLGYFISIPSIIAILLGLIMGGVQHPWSSWRVILPLVLGGLGWIIFHIQQSFSLHPRYLYHPITICSNIYSYACDILLTR
jgi:MFS family permease